MAPRVITRTGNVAMRCDPSWCLKMRGVVHRAGARGPPQAFW
jgi:hypothetical protein